MSKDDVPFRSALGNVWGDLENELSQSFDDLGQSNSEGRTSLFRPTMNMVETQDELVVTFDLPGVSLQDITIEMKSGELSVSGSRQSHAETTEGKWHYVESRCGQFVRTVRLGSGVDSERTDAEFKDGVLRIRIPKVESTRSRKIDIRS